MIGEERNSSKFTRARREWPSPGAETLLVAKTQALSMGNPPWDTLCGEGEGASLMARCAGLKRDGGQCATIVKPSQSYCYQHDPERGEERRINASRAARARHDPEIREIKNLLKDLYAGVLEGRVERAAAAVASQVANTRIRAIEVERRMREADELEERLDELEGVLEAAERRRHVSRR